jgi:hypothetical protein
MRRGWNLIVIFIALSSGAVPVAAQNATALRRTQLANDLLRMKGMADDTIFSNRLFDIDPEVSSFLEDPSDYANAPSAEDLEFAIDRMRALGAANFTGQSDGNPYSSFDRTVADAVAAGTAGLPSTAIVLRATTNFIAGRVKDELVIEYVEKLDTLTSRAVVRELATNSRTALRLVENTNYRLVLPLLKESVVRDFRALPARLVTSTTYEDASVQPDSSLLSIAAVAVRLGTNLMAGKPVLEALAELEALMPMRNSAVISPDAMILVNDTLRHTLIVLGTIAGEYAEHPSSAEEIVRSFPLSAAYFAAFLAQDITTQRSRFAGITDPDEIAAVLVTRVAPLTRLVSDLETIVEMAEAVRSSETQQDAARGYISVVTAIAELTEAHGDLLNLASAEYLRVAREATQRVGNAYAAWAASNYSSMLVEVLGTVQLLRSDDLPILNRNVTQFLVFAAAFADADDEAELEAVIESAALPPGSYRVKRQTATLGLTAYGGGAAYPWEEVEDGDSRLSGGLAFPLGFEFSFPLPVREWRPSISLFISAIDVGNLISLREGESAPDPTWAQVLAPGLGLHFGLGGSNPWSLGVLAQRVPQLRESDGEHLDVTRVGFFLGLDMPLMRLWAH